MQMCNKKHWFHNERHSLHCDGVGEEPGLNIAPEGQVKDEAVGGKVFIALHDVHELSLEHLRVTPSGLGHLDPEGHIHPDGVGLGNAHKAEKWKYFHALQYGMDIHIVGKHLKASQFVYIIFIGVYYSLTHASTIWTTQVKKDG